MNKKGNRIQRKKGKFYDEFIKHCEKFGNEKKPFNLMKKTMLNSSETDAPLKHLENTWKYKFKG